MDIEQFNIPTPDPSPKSGSGTRKLAAIMFTDIKDFSGRMQRDEDGAMRLLKIHNTMMQATVAKYSGVVIKTLGDAFLVTFNSVVSATQCAIEVQQDFYEYNLQFKSDDDKILVRIGVHLGDVFETDKGDVLGDGVNIASRLQSLAEVGGLNISESVYQQVKTKLNIRVINLGVPQLKGINEAIKVYQVIVIPSDKARGTIATNMYVFRTILRRKKTKQMMGIGFAAIALVVGGWYYFLGPVAASNTVAILPFENLGDSTHAYMADGMAEDIYNYLSRGGGMHVVSSATTGSVKDSKMSELDIARKFGVRYILTAKFELRKSGTLRVRYRLADPFENRDIDKNTYPGTEDEIPNIEQEIIRSVQLKLSAGASATIDENIPAAARDDYYQGLDYDRKQNSDDNQKAILSFQSAVDQYPRYVDARLKLANCEIVNHEFSYDLNERWLTQAEQHIKKVYEIDSTYPELYSVWGRLLIARGDHQGGIAFLERCLKMNPNYMRAYLILGDEYLRNQSDPVKAITYWSKAYDIEPSNFNTSMDLGIAYAYQKNYPEAVKAFRRATILNATHELPWYNLGYVYTLTGANDSAQTAYREALRLNPANPSTAVNYATLLLKKGEVGRADSVVKVAIQLVRTDYGLLYMSGYIKMMQGKTDSAHAVWRDGLRLAEAGLAANPSVADHYHFAGLFSARLGDKDKATRYGNVAFGKDSSEENAIGLAKIYATIGDKERMIQWFTRARTMNSEYDQLYIANDIDFQSYRSDPGLLAAAKPDSTRK